MAINEERAILKKKAAEMRNRFNLDALSEEERDGLDMALSLICSEKNKEKAENETKELKEKYEKKYFNVDDKMIVYVDNIEDKHLYSGWYITDKEEGLIHWNDRKKWVIYRGQLRDGLFTPKYNMAGDKLEEAPITRAIELSQFEVNDWLEKWFEQIQQELIYGICNKQQD